MKVTESILLIFGFYLALFQYVSSKCEFAFGSTIYNLNRMVLEHGPLTYTDSKTASVYKATICNSYMLLPEHCPVKDAG